MIVWVVASWKNVEEGSSCKIREEEGGGIRGGRENELGRGKMLWSLHSCTLLFNFPHLPESVRERRVDGGLTV